MALAAARPQAALQRRIISARQSHINRPPSQTNHNRSTNQPNRTTSRPSGARGQAAAERAVACPVAVKPVETLRYPRSQIARGASSEGKRRAAPPAPAGEAVPRPGRPPAAGCVLAAQWPQSRRRAVGQRAAAKGASPADIWSAGRTTPAKRAIPASPAGRGRHNTQVRLASTSWRALPATCSTNGWLALARLAAAPAGARKKKNCAAAARKSPRRGSTRCKPRSKPFACLWL